MNYNKPMLNLTQTLKTLIAFPTYAGNPVKAEDVRKLYGFVRESIPDVYESDFVSCNGHESMLIYRKGRTPEASLVLQSHVDVVPGDDELFTPKVVGDMLYGRGAFDMKFAIACYIKLLNDLADTDLNIAVWLTSDEEIGGQNGIRYLLNEKGLTCTYVYLPDGSTANCITTSVKGVLHFELQARGNSAHGSRPWEGENAIEKILTAYQAIKNHALFSAHHMPGNWHNTINIGMIQGGGAANQVPDFASAQFDVRFTESNPLGVIERIIHTIAEEHQCVYNRLVTGSNMHIEEGNPFLNTFIQTVQNHNYPFEFTKDHGSSDARFFAEKHIPVIMFMPEGGGSHSDHEWLNLAQLEKYYQVLKDFVVTGQSKPRQKHIIVQKTGKAHQKK